MFPAVQCKLVHLWDLVKREIVTLFNMEIMSPEIQQSITIFQNMVDLSDGMLLSKKLIIWPQNKNCFCSITDAKSAFLLHMLPALFKPTGRPERSFPDTQNCFIAHFEEAKKMDSCDEPRVVLLGSNIFEIDQIAVDFLGRNIVCIKSSGYLTGLTRKLPIIYSSLSSSSFMKHS